MPAGSGLDTVLFLNAGSEATDLAWRLATTATGNEGGIVSANAYHGVTTATTALSPEEWRDGPRPAHVEPFVAPDVYRETVADGSAVGEAIERLDARGVRPAAIFVEPAFTSDGVLAPPTAYFAEIGRLARDAGALVVADEVQAGYGRTGEHLWSFVAGGLEPDLVTLGKPMGNGHPLAAVIARRVDVDRLAERAEFFSTFGGNPVAAAAGNAVLDVIRDERLIEHAAEVGAHLRRGLDRLAERHEAIGDVRNLGLLLGVELVRDRASREPDGETASRALDGMRDRGVLIGSTGPHDNVLKIRPRSSCRSRTPT